MPHQTMDGEARAAYESQSLQLRAELKKWENEWAAARGGKKPGRDDIKQNPDIAQKYKQYNKLRDILAGKVPPPPATTNTTDAHQHRKRTQSDAALLPPQTPSKRSKPVQTPRKSQVFQADPMPVSAQTPSAAASMNTPSVNRTLFSPVAAVPTSISPTPQKDGRVLGLFDLLSGTPSKSGAPSLPVASTPSKRRGNEPVPPEAAAAAMTPTTARFATTPHSKHTTAAAPLHSRPDNGNGNTTSTPFKTPSTNRISTAKLEFTPTSITTPSFLRRRTIATTTTTTTTTTIGGGVSSLDEVIEEESNEKDGEYGGAGRGSAWKMVGSLRLPRKLVLSGRGLSNIVQGLRKIEEEAFAEDEEALREMEMEAEMAAVGGSEGSGRVKGVVQEVGQNGPVNQRVEVEVGDSQVVHGTSLSKGAENPLQTGEENVSALLSGFDDDSILYDGLEEDELQRQRQQQQQQPLRIFKKRGQKRTTRLVNMRPTRTRRPAQQSGAGDKNQEEDEEEDGDLVPETQLDSTALKLKPNNHDNTLLSDPVSDFDGSSASDDEEDEEAEEPLKAETKFSTKDNKTDGVVKRAVRKVKATAHANFKRLKLRNTGSKGGPGHGSRWRRRR